MGLCGWERGPDLASFQKFGPDFDSQKRPVREKGEGLLLSTHSKVQSCVSFPRPGLLSPPSPALRQPASAAAQAAFKGDWAQPQGLSLHPVL